MVTKWDFLKMEASIWLNKKFWVLLKVGCLPYAVEKQPSIPLIILGRNGHWADEDDDDDDDGYNTAEAWLPRPLYTSCVWDTIIT